MKPGWVHTLDSPESLNLKNLNGEFIADETDWTKGV